MFVLYSDFCICVWLFWFWELMWLMGLLNGIVVELVGACIGLGLGVWF